MTQATEMTLHADVADSRIKEHRHLFSAGKRVFCHWLSRAFD
jgi:hypothetical protein